MKSGKKYFIIIMVLVLILMGACRSDSAPNSSGDGSSDGSSSESADDLGPTTTPEQGDVGTAIVVYDYQLEDGLFNAKVKVEIPINILRDPNQPEKHIVEGSKTTTATLQIPGKNAGNDCFVKCEYMMDYDAKGKLTQHFQDGCKIDLQFSGYIAVGTNPTKSGTCTAAISDPMDCSALIMSFGDSHTYLFTKEKPYDVPPAVPGSTRRADIKNVDLPGSVDEACKWGDFWD